MNPFAAFKRGQKGEAKEREGRERECHAAVERVLETYGCRIVPILRADQHSITADATIVALPDSKR